MNPTKQEKIMPVILWAVVVLVLIAVFCFI